MYDPYLHDYGSTGSKYIVSCLIISMAWLYEYDPDTRPSQLRIHWQQIYCKALLVSVSVFVPVSVPVYVPVSVPVPVPVSVCLGANPQKTKN